MMDAAKRNALAAFALAFGALAAADDLADAGLVGAVSAVENVAVSYDGARAKETTRGSTTYNGAGNATEIVDWRADGSLGAFYRRVYDATGRYCSTVETYYADFYRPGGSLEYVRTIERDAAGRAVTERLWTARDGGVSVTSMRYDAAGNLLSKLNEEDGAFVGGIVYERDAAGRVVSETGLNANRVATWIDTTAYDEAGRVVEKRSLSGAGELTSSQRNEYDAAGRLLVERYYDGNGAPWGETRHFYDGRGFPSGTEEYSAGALKSRIVDRMDPAGRRVERIVYRADGTVSYRAIRAYDRGNLSSEETLSYAADGSTVEIRRWTKYRYEYRQ